MLLLIKPEINELIQKTNSNEDLIQHINSLKGFCGLSNTELKDSFISDRLLAQGTIYLTAPIQAKLGQKYANIQGAFSNTVEYTDYITVPFNQFVGHELWSDINKYACPKHKNHIPRHTYQFMIDMDSLLGLLMIPGLDIIYNKAHDDISGGDIFIIPEGINIMPAHYRTDEATQKIICNDQQTNFPHNYYSLEWLRVLLSIERLHSDIKSDEFNNTGQDWIDSFLPTSIAYKVVVTGSEQAWDDFISKTYTDSIISRKINMIQNLMRAYLHKS